MNTIAIIDHGAGNLVSVVNAFTTIGEQPIIVTEPHQLEGAGGVVLPGVGATSPAMRRLSATGLDASLRSWQGPLLGICVGLQLLFDSSDEDGQPCLGLIEGTVEALDARPLPHMGWNDVRHTNDPLFASIPSGEPFYFAHSYAPVPKREDQIIATADRGGTFVAAARSRNRVGVQFHPERSGPAGLHVLSNFAETVAQVRRVA
ncbi:MAG: imidazole glycerol phosphate synthase subunit HisH [Actinomycetota bacterium]